MVYLVGGEEGENHICAGGLCIAFRNKLWGEGRNMHDHKSIDVAIDACHRNI